MLKKNHGFTCEKHWKSVLADEYMIIHQLGSSLCDSEIFNDVEKLYNRKGVKTVTPLVIPPRLSIGPFSIYSSHP